MGMETTVLLRTLLLQSMKAESTKEVVLAIEALCTKEDVEVVRQSYRETMQQRANKTASNEK